MRALQGRCLCGAIEYQVLDNFQYSGFCHCTQCRRFSGSAFSAMGGVRMADFQLLKGQGEISRYVKGENSVLAFCRVCGSSLYAEKPLIGMVHLRLGTLDDTPSLAPQFHSYVASKAEWDHIHDDLPQFTAGRAPKPR